MAEQEEKPIRVVDRRMFTADGELRPDFQPEDRSEPSSPPAEAKSPRSERPAPREQSETAPSENAADHAGPGEGGELKEPQTGFGSLVGWIATNAYAALGLLPDAGGRSRRDLTAARQMVDWLATLEQKTRNNLSFEETDFLSRVLYELRLAFVEVSRRPTK